MLQKEIILVFLLAIPLIVCSQNHGNTPVASTSRKPKLYTQANFGLSRISLKFFPSSRTDVNPWAYRPCYGVRLGLEYPLKFTRIVPSISFGLETHHSRNTSWYDEWGIVQSGYHLQLGLNRKIGQRWRIGVSGWYRWITRIKTIDNSAPLNTRFFEREWQGVSYSVGYTLRNRKIELNYQFSHGKSIAGNSHYSI
ncbi:MAG: hypothetical protein AAFY76_26430, partial [Cyanobacteria bacterium J06649_11]